MFTNRWVFCLGVCAACCLIVCSWTWLPAVSSTADGPESITDIASRSASERHGLPGKIESRDNDEDEGDDEGGDPPQMGQETACCTSSGCLEEVSPTICSRRKSTPT